MDWWIYLIAGFFCYVIIIIFLSKNTLRHISIGKILIAKIIIFLNILLGALPRHHTKLKETITIIGLTLKSVQVLNKVISACEHWARWKDDFELIEHLGVKSYRFSIEWSRIQPQKDVWNEEALDQYCEMIDDLISKGIKPMVTLHHFSHPIWFEEIGGFFEREKYFILD